jgi:hypothetical protein
LLKVKTTAPPTPLAIGSSNCSFTAGWRVQAGFPQPDIQTILRDLLEARGRQDMAVPRTPTIPTSVFAGTGWLGASS